MQAILVKQPDTQCMQFLKKYQLSPFIGPSCIISSKLSNYLYFTDSGPFSETNLQSNNGSIYQVDVVQDTIKPLALKCLSYPSSIALNNEQNLLYACQMGKNRLLRFYQSPQGIFYFSVFYQFSGRFGPSSCVVANNNIIYVALFEFKNLAQEGLIYALNPKGQKIGTLKLNNSGPQISGLFLSKNKNNMMYVTQNSNKPCCIRLLISNQIEEQEKQVH